MSYIQGKQIADGAISTSKIADGALSADAAGRAKFATSVFDNATVDNKFSAGSIDLNKLAEPVVNVTSGTFKYYVDTVGGDDANDGLSAITAKKTFAGVVALLAGKLAHDGSINCKGKFSQESLSLLGQYNANLIIDGGSDITEVVGLTNSDINSTSTIGLTTAGWTIDAYVGMWVLIDDAGSPANGQIRKIQQNTATTLTVDTNFTVDPGVGADFKIIRPSTEIESWTGHGIKIYGTGTGTIRISRFYFSSNRSQILHYGDVNVSVSHCVMNSKWNPIVADNAKRLDLVDTRYDPNTFTEVPRTSEACGVSCIHADTDGYPIMLTSVRYCDMYGFYARYVAVQNTALNYCGRGSRFRRFRAQDSVCLQDGTRFFHHDSGSQPVIIDQSAEAGLYLKNTDMGIGAGVYLQNNTTHAIECEKSQVKMIWGDVLGAGNLKTAVYAHAHSAVFTKKGTVLSLAGNLGHLAIANPNVEDATWTEVDTVGINSVNGFTYAESV